MIDSIPGIDYRFADPGILEKALTHRSAGRRNYERLEFLGDSVLDLVISDRLLQYYPDADEGELSRMRARLVRGDSLGEVAEILNLGKYLHLGPGERKSGGKRRRSILADSLEAVIGAVYRDGGYEACVTVVQKLFDPLITQLPEPEELKDSKTRLQERLQAQNRPLPVYTLIDEQGADHEKHFFVRCSLSDGELTVEATAKSLRKAEQRAAAEMLTKLAGR